MFSKACEYAIRSMIFVHHQTNAGLRSSLRDISAEIGSPEAFTAKILQKLTRENLLSSAKGPGGGFEIGKENICLTDIVSAIDGDALFTTCGLGLKRCSEVRPCPVHFKFKVIRNSLREMLDQTDLDFLSRRLKDGKGFLTV